MQSLCRAMWQYKIKLNKYMNFFEPTIYFLAINHRDFLACMPREICKKCFYYSKLNVKEKVRKLEYLSRKERINTVWYVFKSGTL